jgi:acetoin utilization protein AcuB
VIVANRMSPTPWTIGTRASVQEALGLMQQHGVRHLPVMEEGVLKGMVTDIDLRTAYFPSLLEDLTVVDVMAHDPLVIQGDETVYQAARLIHQHKLTGLPVMRDGELVGIITLADILKVFVNLMGLLEESSRLDIALRDSPGSLEEVYGIIRKQGGSVISVAQISDEQTSRVYSFRLKKTDLKPVIAALEAAGHGALS